VDFNHNQISAEDEGKIPKTPFPPQLMSWPTLMPIGISSHFLAFLVS
jgi:hypothetical protein